MLLWKMVSYSALKPTTKQLRTVLILVVVEDGLVLIIMKKNEFKFDES